MPTQNKIQEILSHSDDPQGPTFEVKNLWHYRYVRFGNREWHLAYPISSVNGQKIWKVIRTHLIDPEGGGYDIPWYGINQLVEKPVKNVSKQVN